MNRFERYEYAKKLAALEAEVSARIMMEKMLGKREAKRLALMRANDEEARSSGWRANYDYARAFDGPLDLNGGW